MNEKKIQVNLRRSVPLRPSLSVYIGVMRSQRLVTIDSWCLINILYVCMYVCMYVCVYDCYEVGTLAVDQWAVTFGTAMARPGPSSLYQRF